MSQKRCPKCDSWKPLDLFSRGNGGKVGCYCRECAARLVKEWRDKNPEKQKAIKQKSYWSNPERARENSRRAYRKNPQYGIRYAVEWNRKNKKLSSEYRKRYFKKNPEKLRFRWRNRSHRKRSNGNYKRFTIKDWDAIKKRFNHRCCYCGRDEKLTQDHIIPLAKGGAHSPENIAPACRDCNSRKQDNLGWGPVVFPMEILV